MNNNPDNIEEIEEQILKRKTLIIKLLAIAMITLVILYYARFFR